MDKYAVLVWTENGMFYFVHDGFDFYDCVVEAWDICKWPYVLDCVVTAVDEIPANAIKL